MAKENMQIKPLSVIFLFWDKMKIYIKFLHKDDVFAIKPLFDLVPSGEPKPLLACSRCGTTLYISIEIAEEDNISVSQSMGSIRLLYGVLRGLSRERPKYIQVDEPDLPVLEYNQLLSPLEQQRLRQFCNVCYVDDDGFEMFIADFGTEPVEHKCEDLCK